MRRIPVVWELDDAGEGSGTTYRFCTVTHLLLWLGSDAPDQCYPCGMRPTLRQGFETDAEVSDGEVCTQCLQPFAEERSDA